MRVADKKASTILYFRKELRELKRKSIQKKTEEMKAHDLKEKNKIFIARQNAMIRHEERCDLLKEARQAQVDSRQAFLKKATFLNII